ncbi:MAG TPA: hypothetical protein VE088_09165 [Gaiellaceae bacterium]|jgi:hypothetical protein|nr:hypothetical protein [Gaiellaceae bacterium]
MRSKRFGLLAAILVALNLVLWLAPAGLALRRAVITQLFGPRLVRAEVIESTGGGTTNDIRIDRGVVVTQTSSDITLHELDGRSQDIPLSATTRMRRRNLVGWRVLVVWSANGPAMSVQAEKKVAKGKSNVHRKVQGAAHILRP